MVPTALAPARANEATSNERFGAGMSSASPGASEVRAGSIPLGALLTVISPLGPKPFPGGRL